MVSKQCFEKKKKPVISKMYSAIFTAVQVVCPLSKVWSVRSHTFRVDDKFLWGRFGFILIYPASTNQIHFNGFVA